MVRVSSCPFLKITIDAGLPIGSLCICSITLPVPKEFFGSPEEESSILSLIPKTAAKESFRLPEEVSSTLSFLIPKIMPPGLNPERFIRPFYFTTTKPTLNAYSLLCAFFWPL